MQITSINHSTQKHIKGHNDNLKRKTNNNNNNNKLTLNLNIKYQKPKCEKKNNLEKKVIYRSQNVKMLYLNCGEELIDQPLNLSSCVARSIKNDPCVYIYIYIIIIFFIRFLKTSSM